MLVDVNAGGSMVQALMVQALVTVPTAYVVTTDGGVSHFRVGAYGVRALLGLVVWCRVLVGVHAVGSVVQLVTAVYVVVESRGGD